MTKDNISYLRMVFHGSTLWCFIHIFCIASSAHAQSTYSPHRSLTPTQTPPLGNITGGNHFHLTGNTGIMNMGTEESTALYNAPLGLTTIATGDTHDADDDDDEDDEDGGGSDVEGDLEPEGTWSWHPMSWPWTSILVLNSAIIGVIGNTIVIIVVFNRRVTKNSTDLLIGSLAVADLLSSIAIVPVPAIKYVPSTWLGEVYCRVVRGQIFVWFFVTASIFTLTAISVERYVAVIYPFTFRRIFSIRRTTGYIILIWMICAVNYITYYYFFIKVEHGTHTCQVPKDPPSFRLFGGLSQVIFKFICPLFVMVITQALIIITLHRQARRFKYMSDSKTKTTHAAKSHQAKGRVLKMLLLVVITFMVCWSPSQMSFLLYSAQIIGPEYLYSPLNRVFTVMGFYNSCANPIIYTISNAQFRLAVKSVLTRKDAKNLSAFGINQETENSDTATTNVQSA